MPPTRKVFFLNKAISHLSYPSPTGWFVFPGLRAPRPLEDICCQGEDAHRGGPLLEFMLHTGPFVTLSDLQHFFGYSKCLDGRVKPLPSLLINVHRVLSCNKLANPGHKIVIYTDGFAFANFPVVFFFFCTVSVLEMQ